MTPNPTPTEGVEDFDSARELAPNTSAATPKSAAPEVPPTLQEELRALAERHFAASNEHKRPQWYRKAHAHAWAGVCQANAVVDRHLGGSGSTSVAPHVPQPIREDL